MQIEFNFLPSMAIAKAANALALVFGALDLVFPH